MEQEPKGKDASSPRTPSSISLLQSAPYIASEEMMDVIPDYGDGVSYEVEDLKSMRISKKPVV
ncbi:hypothetical protein CRE_17004 [Caenorhabditis remanei]|uniref:Uncharacterized protein n=1 Tax=Caenorhabditis remanei TaxID=31234 RepID=E3N7X6_CAERE|nr:hypothetical protein CRE_17004 [Caenorhabditis remanei]